jgi:hypothetical protein
MFYPSEQGNNNDNTTKVPAQYILASEGFMESWAQNLSQPDLDEGKRQVAPLYARRGVADDNVINSCQYPLRRTSACVLPGTGQRRSAGAGSE